MPADPPDPRFVDIPMKVPSKHHWSECFPVVLDMNTGRANPQDPPNKKILAIFRALRADEQIKFHQFTCLNMRTPPHVAVMEKIAAKLKAAGVLEGQPEDEGQKQRLDEYLKDIRRKVLENGFTIQGVFNTDADQAPPFMYTIGLTEAGLPELIMSWPGEIDDGAGLLTELARRHIANEIQPGDLIKPEEAATSFLMAAIEANPGAAVIRQACNYIGDPENTAGRVRTLQIVWSDDNGLFPIVEGYDQLEWPQELFTKPRE